MRRDKDLVNTERFVGKVWQAILFRIFDPFRNKLGVVLIPKSSTCVCAKELEVCFRKTK